MKKTLLTTIVCLSLTPVVMAEKFDTEIELVNSHTNTKDVKNNIRTLNTTHYFTDVDNQNGPLAENGFLSKSSSVSMSIGRGDSEVDDVEFDSESIGFGYRYVNPDDVVLGISASQTELKPTNGGASPETLLLTANIGAYFNQTSFFNFSLGTVDVTDGDNAQVLGLSVKTVQTNDEGVGFSTTVSGSRTSNSDDNGDSLGFESTYYFSRYFGWGISYDKANTDSLGDGRVFSTSLENFFSNDASVKASYIQSDYDELSTDLRIFELSVRIRM